MQSSAVWKIRLQLAKLNYFTLPLSVTNEADKMCRPKLTGSII